MGIMDKIRGLFAGPTHEDISGGAASEQVAEPSPTYESAATAEEDVSSEEAPPDLGP